MLVILSNLEPGMGVHNNCACFIPFRISQSGHQPMVRVWNREAGGNRLLGQLAAHHFRISAVRFSPASSGGSHIVSVGCQEDQMICLWDRAHLQKIASAKVSARVSSQ